MVDEIGYDLAAHWPRLTRPDRRPPGRRGGDRGQPRAVDAPRRGRARRGARAGRAAGWRRCAPRRRPDEVERIAAACAVADRALAALLPEIRPGVTEHDLALRLEWLMRTGGAESLAFDVACLAGPEAALPHGSPGDRLVLANAVLLFDFGAQVEGYRSDMTRTLFVGEPRARDLEIYELVARAQQACIDALQASVGRNHGRGGRLIGGQTADAAARDVIKAAGHGDHFGHGTGHGIGLATHEEPRLSYAGVRRRRCPAPRCSAWSPGVYLEGETGVRIEDLVHLDTTTETLERLTHFPREPLILGA